MKDLLKDALLNDKEIITAAEETMETSDGISVRRKIYSGHRKCMVNVPKDAVVIGDDQGRLPSWNLDKSKDPVTESLESEDNLEEAKLVFVGGKGLGSKDNFLRLKALAEKMGASCGCSRPVAINGWESYSRVVGISGSRLHAEICVTFGVSGASPMLFGLEKVKKLIAINSDKAAQIFKHADMGIVEDCIKIITEMENNL